MEGLNNFGNKEKIGEYEEILWGRAAEFSLIRQALEDEISELEALFREKPLNSLNLYEQEQRRSEESRYWEIKEEIDKIKREEDKLEETLIELDSGVLDLEKIKALIPEQNQHQNNLSKRKKRIIEEKQRLGEDPRNIMSQMYGEFGNEKMHLTTGRHATGVKNLGTMDPLSAAAEFYFRTVDTHGGKVDYGKRSPTYVSAGGKRIRKK